MNNSLNFHKKIREFSMTGRGLSKNEKGHAVGSFVKAGIKRESMVIWDYKKYFKAGCYNPSLRTERRILKELEKSGLKGVRIQSRLLKPGDWLYKWQESYRLTAVGKLFLIVPAWKASSIPLTKRIPIVLDPGSAFGTGGHETTQLMIRLMERLKGKWSSFLDAGTGSGILSVAASKLGAAEIVGFDSDSMSVKIAKKNYEKNLCPGGRFFRANLKRLPRLPSFDVVGANLLSKTLLEYRSQLLKKVRPGGHLIVSGISRKNFPGFRKQFKSASVREVKILLGRSWGAALYRIRKF